MSPSPRPPESSLHAVLERLARHGGGELRYGAGRQIAQGGMGSILEVEDLDLHRRLAMKVTRAEPGELDRGGVFRFLEEAQVTAQLSHPGIVPVHELGIDRAGRVFFTMALVEGRDLEQVLGLARQGAEGWSTTRVLGVLHKVCETMAYAHSRGVIHRDLKPANVMVGAFGEVYVMDWGLAKVAGRAEPGTTTSIRSDRVEVRADEESSSLATQDGTVVGTPSYMSPEQARGEELDARADVYAIGVMIYTLLAGQRPYSSPNVALTAWQIVQSIRKGPPAPLARLVPHAAPELCAICEKAMAREREGRYADVRSLADDLRAFLENRVVQAYRTGAWIEFRKWVQRNKALASSLAGGLLVAIAGVVGFAVKEQQRASTETRRAQAESARADTERLGKERVLRLSDLRALRSLQQSQEELWPASPVLESRLADWSSAASALLGRLETHEADLAALEARAQSRAPDEPLRFADENDAWWHETLGGLIAELRLFRAVASAVEARLELARTLRWRTLDSPEARERWRAACEGIGALEPYHGLQLAPALGLLPLGRDPASGLWEFWHVPSGAEPARDVGTGQWRIEPATGIVLVLLPGGTTALGSRQMRWPDGVSKPRDWAAVALGAPASEDWGQPWFDAWRGADEVFVEELVLDAFYCSKYELTQAQCERVLGRNPSQIREAARGAGPTNPVESVDFQLAERLAQRLGLALPCEGQWEYAARSGTSLPFVRGPAPDALLGLANFADASYVRAGGNVPALEPGRELDDGFAVHAPVGSLDANVFGLHDMLGNVWEWCRDPYTSAPAYAPGSGAASGEHDPRTGVLRGGGFHGPARESRPANRHPYQRSAADSDLGLRLCRGLGG